MLAVFAATLLFLPWMLGVLIAFMTHIIHDIPTLDSLRQGPMNAVQTFIWHCLSFIFSILLVRICRHHQRVPIHGNSGPNSCQ